MAFRSIAQGEGLFRRLHVRWSFAFRVFFPASQPVEQRHKRIGVPRMFFPAPWLSAALDLRQSYREAPGGPSGGQLVRALSCPGPCGEPPASSQEGISGAAERRYSRGLPPPPSAPTADAPDDLPRRVLSKARRTHAFAACCTLRYGRRWQAKNPLFDRRSGRRQDDALRPPRRSGSPESASRRHHPNDPRNHRRSSHIVVALTRQDIRHGPSLVIVVRDELLVPHTPFF